MSASIVIYEAIDGPGLADLRMGVKNPTQCAFPFTFRSDAHPGMPRFTKLTRVLRILEVFSEHEVLLIISQSGRPYNLIGTYNHHTRTGLFSILR